MRKLWLTLAALLLTTAVALAQQGQNPPPQPPPGNPPSQPGTPPPNQPPATPPAQPGTPPAGGQPGQPAAPPGQTPPSTPANPAAGLSGLKARVTQVETGAFPTVHAFVAVTDPSGAMVKTLKETDFAATENGTPVTGLHFAGDAAKLPLAIMFVVDESGSMQNAIEQEKQAIRDFVAKLKPDDRVGLVTFSDAAITQVKLTNNHDELLKAVDGLMVEGQTALWDGVYTGMEELLSDPTPARRAMIVLSDGGDNRSQESLDTIIQAYNDETKKENKGFSAYTLGLGDQIDRMGLTSLADQTSGTYIESPTPEDLGNVYDSILSQIQGEYLLEYTSPVSSQPGQIIDLAVNLPALPGAPQGKYTYRSPGLSKALARAIWPGLIAIIVLTLVLIAATIYKLTRRAWVTVMITPLEGREYTLKTGGAEIGSSEGADIRVGRDPAMLPHHASLKETTDGFVLQAVDPDAPIIFADRMLARKLLRSGDKFVLGTTTFSFRERVERPGEELLDAAGVELEQLAPLTVGGTGGAGVPPANTAGPTPAPPAARTNPTALSGISGPYTAQRFDLRQGANAVGRTEGDIVLNDTQVSRKHCVISVAAEGVSVTDAGSTNGTFVNGARVAAGAAQQVYAGDSVQIGATTFRLE